MDHSTQAVPEPAPVARPHDPLAVALANASLLGAGYLIMGRHKLTAVSWLVTVALVALHVSVARSVWVEVVVLLWWVVLIVHGWFLAGGRTQRVAVRRQRLVALGVTVPVLLAVGLLRFDAAKIERTVTEARNRGDCAQALVALDRVWLGHRVADAPLTARGERTVQACQRLQGAQDQLTTALNGDTEALKAGFDGLASVLVELPGHERMVDVVLDGFLGGLPAENPCHTVTVTDWLGQRQASNNALDRSVDAVARTAPAALVGCGDDLMAAEDWETARTRYQQLLDQYPDDERAAQAQEGVTQATQAIELANVRSLLEVATDTQPEYCSTPARYGGAAEAVLVVCADEDDNGTAVETCPYENNFSSLFPVDVTFHRIAIPVKAYELRTGKLVADRELEISGESCPEVLEYTYYSVDIGPPSDVYVDASNADVRDAFRSLINR